MKLRWGKQRGKVRARPLAWASRLKGRATWQQLDLGREGWTCALAEQHSQAARTSEQGERARKGRPCAAWQERGDGVCATRSCATGVAAMDHYYGGYQEVKEQTFLVKTPIFSNMHVRCGVQRWGQEEGLTDIRRESPPIRV
eukprot:scaffold20435_cov18-Tisochrysis_lutea.AAC.2